MGLFKTIQSLLQGSFAKETYNFKEPTNRSHPITCLLLCYDKIENVALEEVCVYLHIKTANEMYTSEKETHKGDFKCLMCYNKIENVALGEVRVCVYNVSKREVCF